LFAAAVHSAYRAHHYARRRCERRPHPDPSAYAKKFSGPYEHRTITGGIGHNLPQEAPQAFAEAVIDATKL
jgi:pimeloyl-ACP methyl ester carboxylesterase